MVTARQTPTASAEPNRPRKTLFTAILLTAATALVALAMSLSDGGPSVPASPSASRPLLTPLAGPPSSVELLAELRHSRPVHDQATNP